MSTRANVVLQDSNFDDSLWFYRHSDGYPEGALPTLEIFLSWVNEGKIRNNVEQSAGWLIMIGAAEYDTLYEDGESRPKIVEEIFKPSGATLGWKVGAYEPAVGLHWDIEYLYIVDLDTPKIEVYEDWPEEEKVEEGMEGYEPIKVINPGDIDISESGLVIDDNGDNRKLTSGST